MTRHRIHPETHPTRILPLIDDAAGSVHRLQQAVATADPEQLREILAETLAVLQTTTDCVAILARRAARARN